MKMSDNGAGCYLPVFRIISRWMETEGPVVIAIDGRCGSGKSSLAAQLQREIPCNVVHMDEFYLPPQRRCQQWAQIPAGNMDLERLLQEVLRPLRVGEQAAYRPFSCKEENFLEEVLLLPHKLTIIEGSYSHHPLLAEQYQGKIFLTCSKAEQEQRLRLREGERFVNFQNLWIPMEERYFQTFQLPGRDALVLDTSGFHLLSHKEK